MDEQSNDIKFIFPSVFATKLSSDITSSIDNKSNSNRNSNSNESSSKLQIHLDIETFATISQIESPSHPKDVQIQIDPQNNNTNSNSNSNNSSTENTFATVTMASPHPYLTRDFSITIGCKDNTNIHNASIENPHLMRAWTIDDEYLSGSVVMVVPTFSQSQLPSNLKVISIYPSIHPSIHPIIYSSLSSSRFFC